MAVTIENEDFISIMNGDKSIPDTAVIRLFRIRDCHDRISRHKDCSIVFDKCKTLFVSTVDKNSFYYYIDQYRFPNVETIYLCSHPCDYSTYHRFDKSKWHIVDYYRKYFPTSYELITSEEYNDAERQFFPCL